MLEYTFPLGINGLDDALESNKFLYMQFTLRLRDSRNQRVLRFISTRTKILQDKFIEKCATSIKLQVSLAEFIDFKVLDGFLLNKSHVDIHNGVYAANTSFLPPSREMIKASQTEPVSFLILGDESVLEQAYSGLGIQMQSIFTMYFISNVKKESVMQLLNTGKAYNRFADGSIQPTDDLLRICPLNAIQGVSRTRAFFRILIRIARWHTHIRAYVHSEETRFWAEISVFLMVVHECTMSSYFIVQNLVCLISEWMNEFNAEFIVLTLARPLVHAVHDCIVLRLTVGRHMDAFRGSKSNTLCTSSKSLPYLQSTETSR